MKIIYVDIDETICFYKDQTIPRRYGEAVPNYENIAKINKLYSDGNIIVYFTARGSRTGIDWHDFTDTQLKKWGCKYHKLDCKKPYYDVIIDDKSKRIEEI